MLSVTGVPVSILASSLCGVALLLYRAMVVVMVVVVLAVFGPAAVSVPIPIFGGDVTRLGGCAQVCAQA